MKDYEFYGWYANLPLPSRFIPLNFIKTGDMTISSVYNRIKEIDDQIRPVLIEKQHLLAMADEYKKAVS